MKKVLIAGAGGAPSEGVIKSLIEGDKNDLVIGMGSEPTDLILSSAHKKIYIPYANTPEYKPALLKILNDEKPDLVHFQNDLEIYHASLFRNEILATGTKLFMPDHDVIDTCVHKYKTYLKCIEAGIKVPRNIMIDNEDDLKKAFHELADQSGKVWLRASSIGGGGKGALPTDDYTFAKGWIQRYNGWGDFVAAEMLTSETVTWLSIWHDGELIAAQTRLRKGWTHGNRTVSGITGVTKVGQTYSNSEIDRISIQTIKAVDNKPHGIYGVDMAYDKSGIPNPTEINISRFFTTVLFFTQAGLNMPHIFKELALYNKRPKMDKIINPLDDGLLWLRGMDTLPKLFREEDFEKSISNLK